MRLPPELQAVRGRPVALAARAVLRWIERWQLRAGPGIRLSATPYGMVISATVAPRAFAGAFYCRLSGDHLTVGDGTVNGITPAIGTKRISGESTPPTLKLSRSEFDASGRSWICIRATVTRESASQWKIDPKNPRALQIVQSKTPKLAAGPSGLHPVATLIRRKDDRQSLGTLRQITYFDLAHAYAPDRKMHFFFAA